MDEARAKAILGDTVQSDGSLYCLGHYTSWLMNDDKVTLDDEFTAHELEAIVWWMTHKKETNNE